MLLIICGYIRSIRSAGSCCWLLLRALWPDFSDGTERQQLRQLLVMKLVCHSARKRKTDRERYCIPSFICPSPTLSSCSVPFLCLPQSMADCLCCYIVIGIVIIAFIRQSFLFWLQWLLQWVKCASASPVVLLNSILMWFLLFEHALQRDLVEAAQLGRDLHVNWLSLRARVYVSECLKFNSSLALNNNQF